MIKQDDPALYRHTPVMTAEVLSYMNCGPGQTIVDGTLGCGGHFAQMAQRIAPHGRIVGIDQDIQAIEHARARIAALPGTVDVQLIHDNFANIGHILKQLGLPRVDGILLDLGISQAQLQASGRGFSFSRDEALDMRMNIKDSTSAYEVVNAMSAPQLSRLFKTLGEERWAVRIANHIVDIRKQGPITSSRQLSDIICDAVPAKFREKRIHPATRVFMAIRIHVNQELARLNALMTQVLDLLNPGGRICVLSFHSLEDRIVKTQIRTWEQPCTCPRDFPRCVCHKPIMARTLTKKAIRPSTREIQANPMARSTRLRAAQKI